MRKIALAEMEAFVAVASRASFAKAATQLGVSRSYLSETVRSLEERLGVRLLNRTTRSVSLTQAGERFLARLQPVLADVNAALESVNSFRDRPTGIKDRNGTTGVVVERLFGIDAEDVIDGRERVCGSKRTLDGKFAFCVRRADNLAGAESATREHHGHRVAPMIAARNRDAGLAVVQQIGRAHV